MSPIMAAPDWPTKMRCAECDAIGRIYPFPFLEDRFKDVLGPAAVDDVGTAGTFWCPRCSPVWGAFVLEQLTIRSLRRYNLGGPLEPAIRVPGGLPVDDIAFLESELADFFDSPGPLMQLRPHHMGSGPIAGRSDEFESALWLLVIWMRQAKLTGYVTGDDMLGRPMIPFARSVAA